MLWAVATTSKVSMSFPRLLLTGKLEFTNTISERDRQQRIGYTMRSTVNFGNNNFGSFRDGMPHQSAGSARGRRRTSTLICLHVREFLGALGCYDATEGVHFTMWPRMGCTCVFQNAISDTERHQRIACTRLWTVIYDNDKLQVSQRLATPMRRRDQGVWETILRLVCFTFVHPWVLGIAATTSWVCTPFGCNWCELCLILEAPSPTRSATSKLDPLGDGPYIP